MKMLKGDSKESPERKSQMRYEIDRYGDLIEKLKTECDRLFNRVDGYLLIENESVGAEAEERSEYAPVPNELRAKNDSLEAIIDEIRGKLRRLEA